jgi:hypothetical protein
MKKRKRVVLDLSGFSHPELVAEARRVKTKLEGDTTFDPLDTEATALGTAATVLEGADAAAAEAQQLADQRQGELNVARAIVEAKMSVLGAGVEHIAAGDTTIVLRSGFQPQAEPILVGPLGPPQNVEAIMSDYEGRLVTRWKRLKGARTYVIEICLEGTNVWRQAGLSTRARFVIEGLESGKKYRVRVSGIGAAGQGPWSDEAVKMAA